MLQYGQVLSLGRNSSIKETGRDLDEDLIWINLQKRDFSPIMVVSATLTTYVWDTIGLEWQVLWVVREIIYFGRWVLSLFCPFSYTKNYKAGTGICQNKKRPWKAVGLWRHYLEYPILICYICVGDRKEISLSDTVLVTMQAKCRKSGSRVTERIYNQCAGVVFFTEGSVCVIVMVRFLIALWCWNASHVLQ